MARATTRPPTTRATPRPLPPIATRALSGEAALVGIVSDTHGHIDAPVLAAIADCDAVVHAGDIGGASVLERIAARGPAVFAITGNNDVPEKWPAADRGMLTDLPARLWLELPGGALAVEHGHQAGSGKERHPRLRRRYPGARAVVYGHSHRLLIDDDEVPWVLNPGASGRERNFGGPSLLLLTASTSGWRVEARKLAQPA